MSRILCALLLVSAAGCSSGPVDLGKLTPVDWHEDLRYLAATLPEKHINAYQHVSREQFAAAAQAIDAGLDTHPAADRPVEFAKLVAMVGDGHTSIRLPMGPRYPLRFYWFGDDLRVTSVLPQAKEALGARLVSVDGMSLADVSGRLHGLVAQAENPWFFLYLSPYMLIRPEVLHDLGVVTDPEHATFEFERDDHSHFSLSLSPTLTQQGWMEATVATTLAKQHADEDLWFEELPNTHTVYVAFNRYDWLWLHSWKLFSFLDAHPADRLVIDLRGNGGGDYEMGHYFLIKRILARPSLNQKGHLYVLTGRMTFSAAMSNACQFRNETQAILVGEPPSEVPNSYQEHRTFSLPHSGLEVNYSVRYYKFLPTDQPALLPDQEINPDWAAYKAGRDSVLEWVLAQPAP